MSETARCPKCAAKLIDTRVTYRGNQCVPDQSGAYIRTTCINGHWVGNRPAENQTKKKHAAVG